MKVKYVGKVTFTRLSEKLRQGGKGYMDFCAAGPALIVVGRPTSPELLCAGFNEHVAPRYNDIGDMGVVERGH